MSNEKPPETDVVLVDRPVKPDPEQIKEMQKETQKFLRGIGIKTEDEISPDAPDDKSNQTNVTEKETYTDAVVLYEGPFIIDRELGKRVVEIIQSLTGRDLHTTKTTEDEQPPTDNQIKK